MQLGNSKASPVCNFSGAMRKRQLAAGGEETFFAFFTFLRSFSFLEGFNFVKAMALEGRSK